MFSQYQLKIIDRALKTLIANYDEDDLEALMYSNTELESEISFMLGLIMQENYSKTVREAD
jgi:hypothetical protein